MTSILEVPEIPDKRFLGSPEKDTDIAGIERNIASKTSELTPKVSILDVLSSESKQFKIAFLQKLEHLDQEELPRVLADLLKFIHIETDEDVIFQILKTIALLCPRSLYDAYNRHIINKGLYNDVWERNSFNSNKPLFTNIGKSDYIPCLDAEEFYTDGWLAGNCIAVIDRNASTVWLSKNKLMGKQLLTNLSTGEIYVPGKELLERLYILMERQRIPGSNILIGADEALDGLKGEESRIHFARLVQPPQTLFGRKFGKLRKELLLQQYG